MAVLVTTDIFGGTQVDYDVRLAKAEAQLKSAAGLILHSSHRISGGWRILAVWETKDDADKFFTEEALPLIPPGRKPIRTYQDLHSCIKGNK